MTSKVNFNTGDVIDSNILPPKYANKITIAMFIKLLDTKIVANNFFGCSKSLDII